MKNLKKVLALVVAFSMILSVVAFANYADVPADADYAGAVKLLSALEIFEGDDLGNFNPDNTITRAEVAAVVCRAIGLENSANGAKGATQFKDVPADHWASGYVNLASQNGIINGYGDGNFGPEDKVTFEQVVKMVVCACGYEPMAAAKGGFPTGYLVVASQEKITAGVSATAEAARKTVAQIVANAMKTPMMDQTSYGTDAKWEKLDDEDNYQSLLTNRDIYIATGVVGVKDEDKVNFEITEDSDDFEFEDGDDYDFNINGTDICDFEHQNVDAYVLKNSKNDYDVICVLPSDEGETLTIISDDIDNYDSARNEIEYYTDSNNNNKTKTIKLSSSAAMYLNKSTSEVSKAKWDSVFDDDDVELVFVENTGDSKYDIIRATKYNNGKVTSAEPDKDRIEIEGDTFKFDFDDETVTVVFEDAEGNALTLEDFEEDDVVAYFTDNGKKNEFEYIKIINLGDNTVTGTVDETSTKNGKDYVTIDGQDYVDGYGLNIDDEGTFFIGITGKIIDFDGSAASKNYAVILETGYAAGTFNKGDLEVKLLTEDDGIVTYDFTSAANDNFAAYMKKNFGDEEADFDDTKGNKFSVITFKVNAKNEIKSFEQAKVDDVKGEYNAKTQKIEGGKALEDDAIVFNLKSADPDKAYTTDINFLVDDATYEGYVILDSDNDAVAAVLTSTGTVFSDDEGIAIVTKVSKSKDADGQDVYKVNYLKDEDEGVAIFDDDSEDGGNPAVDAEDLQIGDIFVFNADSNGYVNDYTVLGQIDNGVIKLNDNAKKDATFNSSDSDTEFVFGYIKNIDKKNSRYFNITLDNGVEYSVPKSDANRYTYNDKNRRNIIIENGDFLAEDVDRAEGDEVSCVLIRLVDDEVVDVYSFNKRISKTTDYKPWVWDSNPAPQAIESEIEEIVEEEAIPEEIEEVVID